MTEKALPAESAKTQTYIVFVVAGTSYAVPSHLVQHMEMVEQVTPVPNAPRFVEGVVFSRGQVVPVINLRARFGFERTTINQRARLLVIQHGSRNVGLLADEAREFLTIADGSIQPPGDAIGNLSGSYLDGVATLGQRIVLILNIREVVESTPVAAA
ncbi:MAG TPA: chemotaxis protein CheW [Vicinamibacterales bacterium]|jgi:chemotaxis signal transduction protein|nr:chemotaxis protein CheW [Vicinamibacterales bacterium]